tara:strand:+ start:140 stop:841 length:702 start_codon:yes stop_codon:yes gene_type:complete
MKRLLVALMACVGLSAGFVNAEETNIPEFAAVFQITTADEASVAAAFTTFAASDCRKGMPTAMRIMRETWNGDEEVTHSVIWNFADAKAMTQSFGAISQCRAWANASAALSERADMKSQQLMRTLAAGGDYTQDTAYAVWQMAISDEAAYVAAYKKMMDEQVKNGQVNGAWGLWRVQGGANADITHLAFSGAANMEALLANGNPSKAYIAFQKKVAGIRTIHRVNINSVLADL